MSVEGMKRVRPPRGLLPAQVGFLLRGRLLPRDLAATLVDLRRRDEVRITPSGDDWTLSKATRCPAALARYEATLLRGLFAGGGEVRLTGVGHDLVDTIARIDAQLGVDAVRQGWLRGWHRRQLTCAGERLVGELRSFRHELRGLTAAVDLDPTDELAAYVIAAGLGEFRLRPAGLGALADRLSPPADPGGTSDGFLAAWDRRCDAAGWTPRVSSHGWCGRVATG